MSGDGLEQAGVIPVQGGGAPQGAQLKVASHPELVFEISDVKTKVKHPLVDVIKPGNIVPEKTPIIGEN